MFLNGSGGTRKSHLVKKIYNAVSKALLLNFKAPEKSGVLLLGPTGISAVNISGTIHSALEIKPGAKLSGLSDKTKASLRNKLSEVKLLMIDKIAMVSSNLRTEIDASLSDTFSTSIQLPFGGLSVVLIGDYLKLLSVRVRFIFSRFTGGRKMNQLLLYSYGICLNMLN